MVVYCLTNLSFFIVLDNYTAASSEAVGTSFAINAWGSLGTKLLPSLVLVCVLGTGLCEATAHSRVLLGAARQGHLPMGLSLITIETSIPLVSVLFRGGLGLVYATSGSLSFILECILVLSNVLAVFSAIVLFLLRSSMRDAPRSFRAPTPIAVLHLALTVGILVLEFMKPTRVAQYMVGLAVLLAGCCYYVLFVRCNCNIPGGTAAVRLTQSLWMLVPCENKLEDLIKINV